MRYNTQQERLVLPEYGRIIQQMVDYAVTISDRQERQQCAQTIIKVMGNLFPHLRDVPEFNHKLWDHLAMMSGYKLDIDYPCEINKITDRMAKPEHLPYPASNIHTRHYGHLIEELLNKLSEMDEGEERDYLAYLVANQMKKSLYVWNNDTLDDDKVFADIACYTHGRVQIDPKAMPLSKVVNAPVTKNGGRSTKGKRSRVNN